MTSYLNPNPQHTPVLRLAKLRASYRTLRVAGKPIHRLVKHPAVVAPAVAALVGQYNDRVSAFVDNLQIFADACCTNATALSARLRIELNSSQVNVGACRRAGANVTYDQLAACYQGYARLFNSVVDAYQTAKDYYGANEQSFEGIRFYSADIGTSRLGERVTFYALTEKLALAHAQRAVGRARKDGRLNDDDEQMVMQVHLLLVDHDARLVYDYRNGFLN